MMMMESNESASLLVILADIQDSILKGEVCLGPFSLLDYVVH